MRASSFCLVRICAPAVLYGGMELFRVDMTVLIPPVVFLGLSGEFWRDDSVAHFLFSSRLTLSENARLFSAGAVNAMTARTRTIHITENDAPAVRHTTER